MDPIKILKRAWHIVWNYRTLWIFGFILAITASGGGGGGGNSGTNFNYNNSNPQEFNQFEGFNDLDREFENADEFFEYFKEYGIPQIERQMQLEQGDLMTMFWVFVAFIGLSILIGISWPLSATQSKHRSFGWSMTMTPARPKSPSSKAGAWVGIGVRGKSSSST